jgi:hypothetical protein
MTYTEAYRRIVEAVNARRSDTVEYLSMGTVSKWTMREHDDIRAVLESLTMTLRIGVAGKPQHIRDDGKPPRAEDVERVTRHILDYFAQPLPAHH